MHTTKKTKEQLDLLTEQAVNFFTIAQTLTEYNEVYQHKEALQILFTAFMEHCPEDYKRVGTSFWQVFSFLDLLARNEELITFIEVFNPTTYVNSLQNA